MKNSPLLEGELVSLRSFRREDAETYSQWLSDAKLRMLVGEDELSPEEVIKIQEGFTDREDFLEYIIVEKGTGKLVGDISVKEIGSSQPKYGIMIGDTNLKGKGYAKEATDLLFEYARRIGIKEVYSEVYTFNGASKRFHEKYGFEKIGIVSDEKSIESVLYKFSLA